MIRIVLALAALVLLTPVAGAASFDCGKASTPFEEAICGDEGLSLQDEVLAQAYATALGGLSEEPATELKASQIAWLDYARRVCSDDAKPIGADYSDDQKQCLASTFRSRVADLEASRMQGGFRFYPIDRYLVEQDTEAMPEDFVKVADKQYHIVKVDRNDAVAEAFNAAIDAMVVDQGEFFKAGTMETTNQYWYGHGAAHGNYFIAYRHFLTAKKRMLEASDIFEGDDWQSKLGELALAAIKEELGEGFFADSEDDVAGLAGDPLRWDFSEAGLVIQFNIYEVTAYAGGAPTVTIPWDALSGLLAEGAEEIAYY
jgi:uncharacterized protein